jgi:hypothetical protein
MFHNYNFSKKIAVDSIRNGDLGSSSFNLSTSSRISLDILLYLETKKFILAIYIKCLK